VQQGAFGYSKVNVYSCERDPSSLLNAVEKMIRVRKAHHELGWGQYRMVDASETTVFALAAEFEERWAVCVHNLADKPSKVALDLSESEWEGLMEIHSDSVYPEPINGQVELAPYGFRWFARL
jgi:maltose alpha-D-glucosyltransferase/alpha-amylase